MPTIKLGPGGFMNRKENVLVLGASNKPERYSNKAIQNLKAEGFPVIPVHPTLKQIEGFPVKNTLQEVKDDIHTLTVYVGPRYIGPMIEDIIKLKPGRVILNPGTESRELMDALEKAGIPYITACTLVMLRTGQFLKQFQLKLS